MLPRTVLSRFNRIPRPLSYRSRTLAPTIRPLSTSLPIFNSKSKSNSNTPPGREIDDSEKKTERPKASHPTKHEPRAMSSGRPVAEHTKEDEKKRSGLPEQPDETVLSGMQAPQLFTLGERTIVITGGGRGLGLTVAQALLESGSNVVCLDLLPEPSEPQWSNAAKYAKQQGLRLEYVDLDVTNQDEVKRVFKQVFESAPSHAPVRGLFTSAGIQVMMPATSYDTAKFRKVIDVDLTGTFLCAQAFAKEWFERHPNIDGSAGVKGASIAMTGSMSGHIANLGIECAAYNASKAGVIQLAKNLALEWSRRGIRVNTLSPGYIRTALTAAQLDEKPELKDIWLKGSLVGRLSTPDEFRGPVVFLLSDASSYMTGADLLIDGGHCAT
ncbi:short-chain dehydrogenase [Cryptococcus neoformans Tu401-1]|nr:short-chain dehydrogenase [Cryptococcus neoformans var. grubii Tu401-1]OXM76766.1 short-chain dehydrogenase [Cryptococcus neoformans var. grubii Bt63]